MKYPISDVLADSIRGFRLPRYHEIPDMGLYLEQTTKYVNSCISPLGLEAITPSMIRNYVKQGIIANPIKKQYFADHIAHLVALSCLKLVTPLEHISDLFLMLRRGGVYTVPVAYDYFCAELENYLYFRFGLKDSIEKLGKTVSIEKDMLLSGIAAVSHIIFLNTCFRILSEGNQTTEDPQ